MSLLSRWMNYSHRKLDRFNYWACTVIALFLFVFILSPLNTLGNVSFALVLLGFINVLIQPGILKYLFQKEAIWLTIIIVVFSLYALILDGWIRNDMSPIRFRNSVGFLVGLTGFAVFQKYGWRSSWFLPAMILGVWIGGFYSVESMLFGSGIIQPNSFNRIYWGAIAAFQIGFLIVFAIDLFKKQRFFWLMVVAITMIVAVFNLIASGSRGPLVAVFISVPLILMFTSKDKIRAVKLGLVSLCFLFISVFAYMSLLPEQAFSKRITQAIGEVIEYYEGEIAYTSSGIRLQLWRISYQAMLDSTLIGLSQQEIRELKNHMVDQGVVHAGVNNFTHMHSDMFHTLAAYGVLGLLIYLFYLSVLLQYSLVKASLTSVLLFSFIAVFFAIGLTDSYTYSGIGSMLLFTISIFLKTSIRPDEPRQLYDNVTT